MTKQIFSIFKVSALAVVLSFGLSYALAWTAPTATPPSGNVSAPINTSATAQTKEGGLTFGSLYNGNPNYGINGATNPNRLIVNNGLGESALTLGTYSGGYGLDLWVGTSYLAPIYFDNRNEDAIIFRRKTYFSTPVESMRIDANGLTVNGKVGFGYEIVQNSATANGHFSVDAYCPAGKQVLGGGCNQQSGGNRGLVDNNPIGSTGWHCRNRDIDNSQTVTATTYAICARVQ